MNVDAFRLLMVAWWAQHEQFVDTHEATSITFRLAEDAPHLPQDAEGARFSQESQEASTTDD